MNKRGKHARNSTLAKWGGPGAVLAGVLFAVWGYIHKGSTPQSFTIVESTLGTVVPLLFLLGLAGVRTRFVARTGWLGEAGFGLCLIASVWGGVVRRFVDMPTWYAYIMRNGWPPWLLDWFAWLVASLIVISVAIIKTRALRNCGILTLVTGLSGWLFLYTDTVEAAEVQLGHLMFGASFCLGWVAIGYTLWKDIWLRTITRLR